MSIYIDFVFIENFIMDILLLKQTEQISRNKCKTFNLILASVISSTYVVIMIVCNVTELNWLVCKLLLAIVICYICFKPETLTRYIKLITLFFLVSTINVGVIMVVKNLANIKQLDCIIKVVIYMTTYLISKLMISSLWEVYEREINLDELIYDVKLVIKGREFKYKGFLDTGNTVYSYFEDVPIIFAEVKDSEILELIKENKKVNVKTITLSQVGEKTAYILEDIQISKGDNLYKVKAGIVFEHMNLSKSKDYNMILNYKLFNDQMGGIKV